MTKTAGGVARRSLVRANSNNNTRMYISRRKCEWCLQWQKNTTRLARRFARVVARRLLGVFWGVARRLLGCFWVVARVLLGVARVFRVVARAGC